MPAKVLLFLGQGFEELEAAAFTDVMGWSRTDGLEPVEVVTTGLHNRIKANWNLEVLPELLMGYVDVKEFDALAIPGGFEESGYYEDGYNPIVQDMIREFHAAGKPIASVCVGALPVGKSGVLSGLLGTTYHLEGSMRLQQLASFGVSVVNESIVETQNIITSCGPSTALDVAFRLLGKLTSKENVATVRKAMGFEKS